MVTLQILVLSFLVRIQVAQLKKREQHDVVLFFCWAHAVMYTIPPNLPLSALRFFSLLRFGIANESAMLSP